ncbi:50S ribosomal protein L13 [Maize bushy stunt phytoplasma]|uniref:Large ribosomal subunit protein uL13 n=1 Tax=Maize bushy stunt phytoplasma TaxID=202462 RepID=A0ABN4RYU3_9MOLU|nr:50S ribosomal protein L13 [Maize bushy stunt phytoplasma]AOF54954.1 50S ribosomal protein L13 [Maize bushy stunt phytoplasma]
MTEQLQPKNNQKTLMANKTTVKPKWHLVDAKGKTLGRLATKVASILKGKHKTHYTPHIDNGDYVIVVNAAYIHLTGKKWQQKTYYKHSGYPGGLTKVVASEMMLKFPTRMVEKAILGMVPHTKLGSQIGKKLFVYAEQTHNHQAQQPESLEV